MVGVSSKDKWGKQVIEWLEIGGRDQIYKLAKDLEAKYRSQGVISDFSCYIGLPSDIILYYRHRNGYGGVFDTYAKGYQQEAQRMADEWNASPSDPNFEATVTEGRELFGLTDDEVYTDFNWHGYKGAALIFRAIWELIKQGTGQEVDL